MIRKTGIALLLLTHSLPDAAQTAGSGYVVSAPDSTIVLQQAQAVAQRTTTTMKTTAGHTTWSMAHMQHMPRILGNADPIHYTQMLPGVQTNGEYHSGINIEGCDNTHSIVTLGGVPVYNPTHLLGLFSTFVSTHYPAMTLCKSCETAMHPLIIGGQLDMTLPDKDEPSNFSHQPLTEAETQTQRVRGEVEAGLVSSQGTLHIDCTPSTTLTLSGRGSYINLLYSEWIKNEDQETHYTFGDVNLTLVHHHGPHTLTLNSYYGYDAAKVIVDALSSNIKCRWGNNLQALHWDVALKHGAKVQTTAYRTAYHSQLGIALQNNYNRLPSSIASTGINTAFSNAQWMAGGEVVIHNISPQCPLTETSTGITGPPSTHATPVQITAYADYRLPTPWQPFHANIGLHPSLFANGYRNCYAAVDPNASIAWHDRSWSLTLTWAIRHQYLSMTGMSDIGLPTDFWIGSSRNQPPQWANEVNASAETWIVNRQLKVNASLYYKQIHHQQEFNGSLFDCLSADYDLNHLLRPASGQNWGGSIMVSRPFGPVTGWISYSYTHASRHFTDLRDNVNGSFPASHERPHELNAVITTHLRKKWDVCATVIAASGTPFTAPTSFYILGGMIISRYGPHNACRLPAYFRTDLSASYSWQNRHRRKNSINLSIYNATGRKNALFYSIYSNTKEKYFHYIPSSFLCRILPSLSYTFAF